MTEQVVLAPNELAELYCLKTFYDYYRHNKQSPINLSFLDPDKCEVVGERLEKIIGDAPILQYGNRKINDSVIFVRTYQDISNPLPRLIKYINLERIKIGYLDIDQLILKNSVIPLTSEEKQNLRKEYGVPTNKPITVLWAGRDIDFYDNVEATWDLLFDLEKYSRVYIFDPKHMPHARYNAKETNLKGKDIHLMYKEYAGFGLLRDYFAIADIALYSENLNPMEGPMHNFVEATEGGPLFLIPPSFGQFGLKSLSKSGVVRTFTDYDTLKEAVIDYARNYDPSLKEQHAHKRAEHLRKTRKRYMPVIASVLENMLYDTPIIKNSDLEVYDVAEGAHDFPSMRVLHPETRWTPRDDRVGNLLLL